ncbi:MAG: hypothetical protein CXZ00_16215 [Acidobacteria bacterium]|nr:MAG: hypothetical protein CXZ00_16215 [Acidobacteriota bacterium]
MKTIFADAKISPSIALKYRRFIIKVGSNVLMRGDGESYKSAIAALASSIHPLVRSGAEVMLVSSGAIALGRILLGEKESVATPLLSAIGQSALTSTYDNAFHELGIQTAQILLTNGDLSTDQRRQMICDTLRECTSKKHLPILNENDAASAWTGNERPYFEDNDMLAAIIAASLHTECLVLLTDVDGVFDMHPSRPEAKMISDLRNVRVEYFSCQGGRHGRGGMWSKVRAAQFAVEHGCQRAVIANGCNPSVLRLIAQGCSVGSSLDRSQMDA